MNLVKKVHILRKVPMDGFEKRRNDKKKAIMKAAVDLFDRHGFDRVTVSEIAEQAHVSKVSVYNFFESKDKLRRTIIRGILDESLERNRALLEKEEAFMDKIGEYLRLRTWYYGQYSVEFLFDALKTDPEVQAMFEDYTAAGKRLFMEFAGQGRAAGVFSSDVSDTAIELYIDIFQSYIMNNKKIRDALEHNQKLAEELNMLFLDGLIRNKG
jgi:AcrR family transcriptional regulator